MFCSSGTARFGVNTCFYKYNVPDGTAMARSMDVRNKFAYKEGVVAEISDVVKHCIYD